MWVPQWPLSKEKLQAAKSLVEEQLQLGHIRPSVSPWNTPIFVIKKKSGKWRLLHDLRAINAQMQVMGPIQRGLPLLSALPQDWPLIVIDIKDCFFSIPLCAQDSERFAFTLPSCNHEEPDGRYEWIVLPQGMANSPTMCQLYVSQAIEPIRKAFPKLRCAHYMDDVLLTAKTEKYLHSAYIALVKELQRQKLYIAPEKVQQDQVVSYLGARISLTEVQPQKVQLRLDSLHTLNDFQRLLGDINWIMPYLKIPNVVLKPLFKILEGDPDLNSVRSLTPEARQALSIVEKELSKAQLMRCKEGMPINLLILQTEMQPTGLVWQDGPLLWIHPRISMGKTVNIIQLQ